jgi:hypothetical protein
VGENGRLPDSLFPASLGIRQSIPPEGSSQEIFVMKFQTLALTALIFPLLASPQRGTAPPGFYPSNYHGETYTGRVTHAEGSEITLEYQKKEKTETFNGTTEAACLAPRRKDVHEDKEMPLKAIPEGTVLTVYYNRTKERQPDGSKKDANVILALRFDELRGKALTDEGRPIIRCSRNGAGLNVQ